MAVNGLKWMAFLEMTKKLEGLKKAVNCCKLLELLEWLEIA